MRAGDLPLPLTLLEVRLVSRAVRRLIDSPDSLVPSEHLVLASVAARAEMRQGVSWGSDIEQSSLRRLSINRRGDTPSQRSDLGNKINALRKLIMSNYEGKVTLFGVRAGAGATFDSKDDVELVGKSVDVQLMSEGEEICSCDQLRINHDDPSFTAPSLPISGGIGGLSIRLKVKHKHSLLHLSQSSAKSEETSLEDVLRLHEASAHNLCENDEMQSGEDLDKLRKLVGREFEAPWERALSSTHLLYRNQERGMRRMSATSRQGERKLAGTVRLFSKFDPPLFLFSGGFDVSGKVCDWQPIGGAVDDLDEDVVDINADGPWEEETAASAYAIYLLMMKALIADECPQLALPEQHILNSGMLGCNLATIQTHHHGVLTKSSSGQFKTDYTLSQHYGFAELSKTSVSMLQALAQWTNINDFSSASRYSACALSALRHV